MSMFTLKEYSVSGMKLPITALPISGLVLTDNPVDEEKSLTLKNIIEEFRQRGDPILQELASLLSLQEKCTASIVMTSGVPAPYDAWTGNFDNSLGIFFNLDQWSISDLENQGLAVLKHELAHLVIAKHIQKLPAEDFVDRLEQIVLDEGIAHFIGFPRDRGSVLIKERARGEFAEKKLEEALLVLRDHKLSNEEKKAVLIPANTGSYWEKYGAIAGMFRAAKIFEAEGVAGFARAIRSGKLR